jgi:hypothetical protein
VFTGISPKSDGSVSLIREGDAIQMYSLELGLSATKTLVISLVPQSESGVVQPIQISPSYGAQFPEPARDALAASQPRRTRVEDRASAAHAEAEAPLG